VSGSGEAGASSRRPRSLAAVSSIALCLLTLACKEPPPERSTPERSARSKRITAEEEAQRTPPAKPTSPVAAPGAAEPPPRAAEVPQRITGQEDLPTPSQLPVAEDFQAETAATIVRGNYHSELNNLETEMKTDGR
jgi:hypothetical protein